MNNKLLLALLLLSGVVVLTQAFPADVDDEYQSRSNLDDDDDDDDEKRPYSFSWQASRYYHGDPDREHREERGEDGITRGVYRYVDPTLRVQEVIYYADETGFHVENPWQPEYTKAQVAVRERHARLFQEIADKHVQIGAEHALRAEELGYELEPYVEPQWATQYSAADVEALLPENTPAVERAIDRHQRLFERIAEQHARIAAERKTNPEDEETGDPYEYQYDTPLKNVHVVSGFVGPSVLSRAASVTAPGEDHPDFQGYGVPLATFRDDITEEEALRILEEENERHLRLFQEEADNHEALVLSMGMGGNSAPFNQQGASNVHRQGQNTGFSGHSNRKQKSVNRRQGQDVAQFSGHVQQQQYSSSNVAKVQTGNSERRQNQQFDAQNNFKPNQAQFRNDRHNQRAIGVTSDINTNQDQAKYSSNTQDQAQYLAGPSGHQESNRAGGQNQYSSNQDESGSSAHGQAGVGVHNSQNRFSNNNQGNAPQTQGLYSAGNKKKHNGNQSQVQFSAGNKGNRKQNNQGAASSVGTQYQGNQQGSRQGNNRAHTQGRRTNNQGNTQYEVNQKDSHQGNKRTQSQGGNTNYQGNTQYQGNQQGSHQGNKRTHSKVGNTRQGNQQPVHQGNTQFQSGQQGQFKTTAVNHQTKNIKTQFSAGNRKTQKKQQTKRPSHSGSRINKNNKKQNVGVGFSAKHTGNQQASSGGRLSGTRSQGAHQESFHSGSSATGSRRSHQGSFHSGSSGTGSQGSHQGSFHSGSSGTGSQGSHQGSFHSGSSGTGFRGLQQGSSHQSGTSYQQNGTPENYAQTDVAHQVALAIIADQTREHLRQFKKIARAHEEIGDEHHKLTLAAIQKHRMMVEKKW